MATETELLWHDIRELGVEGKGWTDTEHFFDRLPARAKAMVTETVWGLSHDSAGMSARFTTDAAQINARWTLRKETLAMPHMPATGVSGLDLYVKIGRDWKPAGAGRPEKFPTNSACLLSEVPPVERQYLLYLPLYNGVESVEIGMPPGFAFRPLPRRGEDLRPICFYGTSITQGGCASRPGMAYPAILGRWLDRATINLGFSGSARAEPQVAALLAELDPSIYVLDCVPNVDSPETVKERLAHMARTIRSAHPKTPIVLVESVRFARPLYMEKLRHNWQKKNAALRAVYRQLQEEGVRGLHYVPSDDLLGSDGEATVDGVHPTDLGFLRMSEVLSRTLRLLM
jgi:lysophospholipase L1-like esterase